MRQTVKLAVDKHSKKLPNRVHEMAFFRVPFQLIKDSSRVDESLASILHVFELSASFSWGQFSIAWLLRY